VLSTIFDEPQPRPAVEKVVDARSRAARDARARGAGKRFVVSCVCDFCVLVAGLFSERIIISFSPVNLVGLGQRTHQGTIKLSLGTHAARV
jgi:hypothetical protein